MTNTQIHISGSKSISNRFLIMQALSGSKNAVKNLSNSDDSNVLQSILEHRTKTEWNVGHAGTAMRFLTAFACLDGREIELSGSSRMHERPIGPLVDALRKLNVEISYLQNEGYPPLRINGSEIQGGKLVVDGNMSSQFVSALCMIAPCLPNGLELEIVNTLVSRPYFEMTLTMMKAFGVQSSWVDNKIIIQEQEYLVPDYEVESDWSSASYWFSFVALDIVPEITLSTFFNPSLQGDSMLPEIFKQLGVVTVLKEGKLTIRKEMEPQESFYYNFKSEPDLAQTLAVCCFALGLPAKMEGLETLPIKETDRLMAIKTEIEKLGGEVTIENNNSLYIAKRVWDIPSTPIKIETYKDHRMAMCFAPLQYLYSNIEILDKKVVTKSYPDFWKDVERL